MIAAAITVVLAGQFGGSAWDNALVDGDKVHFFLPPVVVSEGAVQGSAWSEDGRYLLTITESAAVSPQDVRKYYDGGKLASPTSTVKLDVFNSATGISKTLWRAENKVAVTGEIHYFEGSDVALAQVRFQDESLLLRITCGTSRVETIESIAGQPTQLLSILPDPKGRYVSSQTFDPPTVRFIGQQGRVLPRVPLETPNYGMWTRHGAYVIERSAGSYFVIDPLGGETRIENGRPDYTFLGGAAFSFKSRTSRMPIPGRRKPISVVIASTDTGNLGVAFDAQEHATCDSGVFYSSGGVNLVRPVIQISKIAFEEIVAKEERAEVMAKLSQIGKALMMYAADNDDSLPTKEQLDERAIDGYLGVRGILEGFTYHGVTAMGANTSQTEAGFMLCPGGRAVLYQDGHVVFVPDPN